jgi:hypothetical protein
MKYEIGLGLAEPSSSRSAVRWALELLLALAASVAYVYGAELVGSSVPLLLASWVASIGAAFALPFLVVRAVSATLAALRL